jgi:hypothetical protein
VVAGVGGAAVDPVADAAHVLGGEGDGLAGGAFGVLAGLVAVKDGSPGAAARGTISILVSW